MRPPLSLPARIRSTGLAAPALLLAAVAMPAAAAAPAPQTPSWVDLSPTPPPTASWPTFTDIAASVGSGGTDYANAGSGRGQAWADLVGPHPTDPTLIGPPDGLLDIVQTNSNSPTLPLGASPGQVIVEALGTNPVPCLVLQQQPDGTFQDVADRMLPETSYGFDPAYPGGSPWGVTVADYDGDAQLDLFYSCGGFNTVSPNSLLRADGDGTFTNVTLDAGISEVQCSFAALWLDDDRDGDLDLFVTNGHPDTTGVYSGPPVVDSTDRLYRNQGDGTFVEDGYVAGIALPGSGFAATTADLDLDGLPDIALSCFKQYNKIYYARGDGTFAFMLPEDSPAGTIDPQTSLKPDPALPGTVDFLAPPALEPGVVGELPLLPSWAMPISATDMNGDGWIDLIFSAWSYQVPDDNDVGAEGAVFAPAEPARVYLNRGDRDGDGRGDGLFRDITFETGIGLVGGVMGIAVGDYNGDGFDDVYMGAGGPTPIEHLEEDYLFINEPTAWRADFQADPDMPIGQAFYEVGALAGSYANKLMTHGVNARRGPSGRMDVVIGNGGPAVINNGQPNVYYSNQGNSSLTPTGFVEVQLTDGEQPLAGLGARVELVRDAVASGPRILVRQRSASQNFSSQYAGPIEIGTGDRPIAYAGVRWADGRRQGRILWPGGDVDEIAFERPSTSVSLDAIPSGGGELLLQGRVRNHGAASTSGRLQFAWLVPDASGTLVLGGAIKLIDLDLAPGEAWGLDLSLPAPGIPTGLWALRYVDPQSGTLINEGAAWVQAPMAPASLPATDSDPGAGEVPVTGPGAQRLMLVRTGFDLPARSARLFAHEAGGALLAESSPADPVVIELGQGSSLRFEGDRAWLDLAPGTTPLALSVRPGGVHLYLDLPTSCCDTCGPPVGKRLEIEGDFAPAAGGSAGFDLRVDGRAIPEPRLR